MVLETCWLLTLHPSAHLSVGILNVDVHHDHEEDSDGHAEVTHQTTQLGET